MDYVRCDRNNCFSNFCGTRCKLLSSPIREHECPFYKTVEEAEKGREWAHNELVRKGRQDLIETYEYNVQRKGAW